MLRTFSEQADKMVSALIGAALGVIVATAVLDLSTALKFTAALVGLLLIQHLALYWLSSKNDRTLESFLCYIVFISGWVICLGAFGRLLFWREGWNRDTVEPRIVYIMIIFLSLSIFSLLMQIFMKKNERDGVLK